MPDKALPNKLLTNLWGKLPLTGRMRNAVMWWLNPKFSVGVLGLVQDEDGRVLLLKHTYRRDKPWGLPGGGLKSGESTQECLLREVLEETGLHVEISRLANVSVHPSRRLLDVVYACRPKPGNTLARFRPNVEVAGARYFDLNALPQAMSPRQKRLIKQAIMDNPPNEVESRRGRRGDC